MQLIPIVIVFIVVLLAPAMTCAQIELPRALPATIALSAQSSANSIVDGGREPTSKQAVGSRTKPNTPPQRPVQDEDVSASVRNWMAAGQSFATIIAMLVAALWAYSRFIREREKHPRIEFSADIHFIEQRSDCRVVELVSVVENKGKVQHTMSEFDFDLYALFEGEQVELSEEFGGQVHFRNKVVSGTWLPQRMKYFFIEPGTKAKYSYIARVPNEATSVILHSRFKYNDGKHAHTAERTVGCSAWVEQACSDAVSSQVGGPTQ